MNAHMAVQPFDRNLRRLSALSAVVAHGALNGAAEAGNLSQPALTQGLDKLERQLGVELKRTWSRILGDGTAD